MKFSPSKPLQALFISGWLSIVFGQSDFLKTDGPIIRNNKGKGDTVRLYGTNIGGWEIIETWMAPMSGVNNEWDARNKLAQRFGWAKAVALKKVYLNSWFKSDDFARISAEKLNCVRLPMLWCDYMDTSGNWLTTASGDTDFTLLDSFVVNARKNGLYVILDLHGAPGSQNNKDHSGRENGILLYNSTKYRTILINWWKGVANHFRGVAAVAGYDLINEPSETYPGTMGAQTVQMYDTLYKEIRKIDPDHIIFMEGIWTWDALPKPSAKNWTNVVYQLHWYYFGSTNTVGDNQNDVNNAVSHMSSWNVPCYVGEFNFNGNTAVCAKKMSQNQISWTIWTFKMKSNMGDWSMYIPNNSPGQTPDLANDAYDQIAQKWNTWDTQNHFTRNNATCDALKTAAMVFGEPKRPLVNPAGVVVKQTVISRAAARCRFSNHTFCFELQKASHYSVSIVSTTGRLVAKTSGFSASGRIPFAGFAPGVYVAGISIDGLNEQRAIMASK